MKIGIETIVDYTNYGNRLQNLALQTVLQNLGHEVVTIRDYSMKKYSFADKVVNSIKTGEFFGKVKENLTGKKKQIDDTKRKKKFAEFTKKYIKESSFYIDKTTKDYSFDSKIDCYVIGSDQVWNYNLPTFSDASFVSYTKKPVISYAASFGVGRIPKKYFSTYQKGLANIWAISVRETAGKDLVKSICHKDAKVVLDPTLLLSGEYWLNLVLNETKYDDSYVLMYFISPIKDDDMVYIKEFAKKRHLGIKNLADMHDDADPLEFVNLFKQANAVFTDSFHACAFSIIFEKYFEVFRRNIKGQNMSSRIDTLLADLGLINRWHNEKGNIGINYGDVRRLLERRRIDSFNFLKSTLMEIENGDLVKK